MVKKIFLMFFVLPFFQNKNKVGIKTTFLLMMENTCSKKALSQVHIRLRWDEWIFRKAVNNKPTHYLNREVVEGTSKVTQLRLSTR